MTDARTRRTNARSNIVDTRPTEQDVVNVVTSVDCLHTFELRHQTFTKFKRRTLVNLAPRLSLLRTLVICGGGNIINSNHDNDNINRFSLTTIGQLVNGLSQLDTLHLETIQVESNAFQNLLKPSFRLKRLVVLDMSNSLNSRQFEWLLTSTCYSETLRSWTIEFDGPGQHLHQIWYTGIRVEHLHLVTKTDRVAEAFTLHCASVKSLKLTFKGKVNVDSLILFRNLDSTLESFEQICHHDGNGVHVVELAALIDLDMIKSLRGLKRISLNLDAGFKLNVLRHYGWDGAHRELVFVDQQTRDKECCMATTSSSDDGPTSSLERQHSRQSRSGSVTARRLLPRLLNPFNTISNDDGTTTTTTGFFANVEEWSTHSSPPPSNNRLREAYEDQSTIDWSYEDSRERIRLQQLQHLPGLKGVSSRLWDATIPWLVIVATGLATGLVASSLDVLSAWLSDMRFGICKDSWWMSQAMCCAGLDPGEQCNAWHVWGQQSGVFARSLIQYSIYMTLAVMFAVTASVFVQVYAPYAFHTGIPEIKTILGGYIISGFLSPMVLLIKSLGLPLAVASGLSLGKEGPLVHVACCIGNYMNQRFAVLKQNEARQRALLSAAAAAGVSVAFGAPLGGVLFSLGSTLWQSFVCAVVAAITLQYIDPLNTGRLVLFQAKSSQVWRGFELIPFILLGFFGGLWGTWFTKLNEEWEKLRRTSSLKHQPVLEVAGLALFTAIVSYLLLFMRIPSRDLVQNLFQSCSEYDQYSLCDSSKSTVNFVFLIVTAFAKTLLTAITFGSSIPAGIFLPSLTIGACVGRAVGIIMDLLQKSFPTTWLFVNCPVDGRCISPPVYAVIGAASALAGVTRMTVSLVVIMFELTGAIDLVLQIMLAVMVAKFTADFASKDGIYETWISIRNYPFLNNKVDYRRDSVLARHVMTKSSEVVYVSDEGMTLDRLDTLLDNEEYRGFPIVRTMSDKIVIGCIARNELRSALDLLRSGDEVKGDTICYFTWKSGRGVQIGPNVHVDEKRSVGAGEGSATPHLRNRGSEMDDINERPSSTHATRCICLKDWVDEIPILLSQDTPMEIVVQMFQRLGLRSVLLTRQGALAGILTKMHIPSESNGTQFSTSPSIDSTVTQTDTLPSRSPQTTQEMVVYALTSASRGLGLNYSRVLLESSNDISVIALVREPNGSKDLQELKNSYGDRLAIVKHEVTSEESAKSAAAEVAKLDVAKNGIDVLINNAGVSIGGPKTALDDDFVKDFDDNMRVNFYGSVYTTTAFLPLLRKGSKKQIWFISTGLASIGFDFGFGAGVAAYSISKTAVNSYARRLSDALKAEGFTIIPLSPGYVMTDMNAGQGAITVQEAADSAVKVFLSATPQDNMKFLSYDGTTIPW
ncbi:chloride channel [Microbotryomycetes sp. JL221]|nr:chloride channel [Microbotryomycetes sp. JL221]